eukprot:CAMPEP_0117473482 /NCGR_PEP_ID=MMETSP0784-20121206/8794_1 /TAXON_ID=39447 /ORGANISM="" /LENGTH=722 /DNA_ID=CAMNT_0005267683 /DNA_START=57 /DNA_END=2225 /DNA_ORIENTATION=-
MDPRIREMIQYFPKAGKQVSPSYFAEFLKAMAGNKLSEENVFRLVVTFFTERGVKLDAEDFFNWLFGPRMFTGPDPMELRTLLGMCMRTFGEEPFFNEVGEMQQIARTQTRTIPIQVPAVSPTVVKVAAVEVSKEDLHNRLRRHVPDSIEEADQARDTLITVAEMLANGMGGVIIAVVDGYLWNRIKFNHLDDGHLTRCFDQVATNMLEQRTSFECLLDAFSAHGGSDRWQQRELEQLVQKLPEAAEPLAKLEGNPKDGAFVVSWKGTVMGAAGHLKYHSERWQLLKTNGKLAGTRHNSSLAFAEWLGSEGFLGAVFVRSDDGGVHAFLPRRTGPPSVLHFDSLQPMSQKEMLELFKDVIFSRGQLMTKTEPAFIRPGIKGEQVMTYVNGRVTSDVTIEDDDSFVVQAPTVDRELYVLSRAKFEANWEQPGMDIAETSFQSTVLKSRGFKQYVPKKGNFKMLYEVREEDLDRMVVKSFMSAWGALQPITQGDFLAMPAPAERATEVYLMPRDVVGCYSACSSIGKDAEKQKQPAPMKKSLSFSCTDHHRTQQEMLSIFKAIIIEHGKVMRKLLPLLARPGKMKERVVTCVNGRVISDTVIADESSMVVRGNVHSELYVLPREKFDANYQTEGADLDEAEPVSRLLSAQGFKKYLPREDSLRYVYKVTADDLDHVPTGFFVASWGALQPVEEGDCLAMPAPVSRATEVYVMPSEVLSAYGLVT